MRPEEYRRVDTGYVFVGDVLAATLTRDGATTTFAYLDDYLNSGGPAVATTLPVALAPVVTTGGAVPAYFAGLLPEGRRLTALRRAVKTSADDELSLLLAAGEDPVGNVSILPSPDPPATVASPPDGSVDFSTVTFADLLADAGIIDPASLAGVQDKVSGRMLTLPLAHGGRCHLLKFQIPEYPNVVENEAFFLEAARALRGPVAKADVVRDASGETGLLVTRFDREVVNGRLTRLATEDASQLLGIHPAQKYAVSTEDVVNAVARVCSAGPVAVQAVLRQVLFAWVTGNGDLHAKNVSVVRRGADWVVSPMYDLPSTYPYGDRTMALPVAGRTDSLSGKRFAALANDVGLPARAAQSLVREVLDATQDVAARVASGALPFDPKRLKDLARVIAARRKALESAAG